MTSIRNTDIEVPTLPLMSWTRGEFRANLDHLYAWVEQVATDAIAWYVTEKRRKGVWSRRLRALALVLATLGGAVPTAALAAGRLELGNWGYVLLALSAGCFAYDRFFGYSSAWQRCMVTATALRTNLVDFQLSWAGRMAAITVREPTADETRMFVDSIRAFAASVNALVQAETESWLTEFNSRLVEFESRLGAREAAPAKIDQPVL